MSEVALDNSTFSLVVLAVVIGFAPAALVLMTAFIKISVVFFILRNAIGIQQTPGNMVLSSIAAVLAIYISAPVLTETYSILREPTLTYQSIGDWEEAFRRGSVPVQQFLLRNTTEVERTFFASAAQKTWGPGAAIEVDTQSLFILIPAFVMHELTAAFKIGFLIYIPFLAIDLIIANILMALGMITLSPVVIGVPFKLLLFIVVDGWSMLVRGLILSYAVT